jgi:alpha-amylase/alpha-mannosidase (GH57 family)
MAEQKPLLDSSSEALMASAAPLRVAFLWHQHQPYYQTDGSFLLPWVRFHGTKDYFDMVRILDDYPKIRQSFNLVPSLLVQIDDYINGRSVDNVFDLSRKKASDLTEAEKKEVLRSFFMANFDHMIKPYPRYLELFEKRGGFSYGPKKYVEASANFTTQDWLDLQVWYNMVWVGEYSKYDQPFKTILEKGRDFTEGDKISLLDGQFQILRKIIPAHVRAQERAQIEVCFSPFYHPILPLLCDTDVARQTTSSTVFPQPAFRHPEDAEAQIKSAIEHYEHTFGRSPMGMWPPEGSVSKQALALMAKHGILWTASDEEVLFRSVDAKDYSGVYRPYRLNTPEGSINIIFRDHSLSDLIGFVYSSWGPDEAAHDFVNRLHSIRTNLVNTGGEVALNNALVSIILDGENCWEYYQSDGKDFLRTLYWLLSNDSMIETTTISDFLSGKTCENLPSLYPGSWINANFKVWIGHEEDNTAWDLLRTTRDLLTQSADRMQHDKNALEKAWEEIYIAEGSDWCWWYGDEHSSENADDFDFLFRSHLIKVYEILGIPRRQMPEGLKRSIRNRFDKFFVTKPTRHVHPVIDGSRLNSQAWNGCGYFDTGRTSGAMHQVSTFVQRIWYGYDNKNLYLRVDGSRRPTEQNRFLVHFTEPFELLLDVSHKNLSIRRSEHKGSSAACCSLSYAIDDVFEVSLDRASFGWKEGTKLSLEISFLEDDKELESWPKGDMIQLRIKSKSALTSGVDRRVKRVR